MERRMRRRLLALLMAVAMVMSIIAPGSGISKVKAEGEFDLYNYVRLVNSDLQDSEIAPGSKEFKPSTNYSFKINFSEIKEEGRSEQYDTGMYSFIYKLPAGLENADFTSTEDVTIIGTGSGDVTYNNCNYSIQNGYLYLNINFNDVVSTIDGGLTPERAQEIFDNTEDVHFDLKFTASIKSGTTQLQFGEDVVINLVEDSNKNISSSKSYGIYDPTTNKLTYTVTLTGSGHNENVQIKDSLYKGTDSALTLDMDSISVKKTNSSGVQSDYEIKNLTKDSFGFSGFVDLDDKETIIVSYSVSVDPEKMSSTTYEKYDNKVYIGSDNQRKNTLEVIPSDPEKTTINNPNNTSDDVVTSSTDIGFLKSTKSSPSTVVDSISKTGELTWTVDFYSYPARSASGKTVTDSFGDNFDTLTLNKNNFTIKRIAYTYDQYQPISTVELSNNDINIDGNKWSYVVPAEDNENYCYKYEIVYKTPVDASDINGDYSINNTFSSGLFADPDATGVGTVKNPTAETHKSVSVNGDSTMDWTVTIDIPESGVNGEVVSLIDNVPILTKYQDPNQNWQDITVDPALKDSIIDGVEGINVSYSSTVEGESFETSLTDDGFKIDFYKMEDGNKVPGFSSVASGSGKRKVTITYSTKNNEDWVSLAYDRDDIDGLKNHINNDYLKVNDTQFPSSATGKIVPTVDRSLVKNFIPGSSDVSAGNTHDTNMPYYKFEIIISGVDDNAFDSNDNIIINDTFNSAYLSYYNAANNYQLWEKGIISLNDGGYGEGNYTQVIPDTSEDGKLVFSVPKTAFNKRGNNYYPSYKLVYYLKIKDSTSLSELSKKAINSPGGKVTLNNTAISDVFGTDDASFDFEYKAVQKRCLDSYSSNDRTADFEIVLNPNKADLDPDSDFLSVTDSYSNLSIDFNSIQILVDGIQDKEIPNNEVHYYPSNNVLNLTIPDGKTITIKYKATAIGTGELKLSNTAKLFSQESNWNQIVDYSQESSSGGSQARINVVKYKDGDMTIPLSGVHFKLYKKATDELVVDKDFITDDNGMITLTQDDGIKSYEYYYLKEVPGTQPEGYNVSTVDWTFEIVLKEKEVDYSPGAWKYISDDVLTITNETTYMSIPVTKVWKGTVGSEAKFKLYTVNAAGNETEVTSAGILTLNSSNNWSGSFDNIPRRNESGATIKYVVKEIDVLDGYTSDGGVRVDNTSDSRIDKGVKFTNTENINGTINLSKTAVGVPESHKDDIYKVTITAKGADTELNDSSIIVTGAYTYSVAKDANKKTIVVNLKKDNNVTITGLPYDEYSVVEETSSDYDTTYKVNNSSASTSANIVLSQTMTSNNVEVINTFEEIKGSIKINKSIYKNNLINTSGTGTFKFGLGRTILGDIIKTSEVTISANGINYVVMNEIPAGTYYLFELDDDNNIISNNKFGKYTVTGSGQEVVIDSDQEVSVDIKNNELTGKINATKKFVSNNSKTDTFYFTLYSVDGTTETKYATAPTKEINITGKPENSTTESTQTVNWEDIPYGKYKVYETDASGNKITSSSVYTIDKEEGLNVTLNSGEANAGTITNTEKVGDIELTKAYVSEDGNKKNFYFQLYSVNGTNETIYGDKQSVEITGSKTGVSKTVQWSDIPYGSYKIYEVDSTGTKVNSTATMKVTGSPVSVTVGETKATGTITNTDIKQTGKIKATKKFVSNNSKTDTFYFTLYSVDGTTETKYATAPTKEINITGKPENSTTESTKTVSWEDIPYGNYTVYETNASGAKIASSNVYTIDKENGLSVTLDSSEVDAGIITNTENVGSVKITKDVKIDGNSNASALGNEEKSTKFKLNIEVDKEIEGTHADVTFTKGTGKSTATAEVSEDSSVTISDLPIGSKISVTEEDGYATAFSLKNYSLAASGNITTGSAEVNSTAEKTVTLVNNYTEDKGGILITKDVQVDGNQDASVLGSDEKNTEFTVNIEVNMELEGTYGDVIFTKETGKSTATANVSENKSISISNLPVGTIVKVNEASGYEDKFASKNYSISTSGNTTNGEATVSTTQQNISLKNNYIQDTGSLVIRKTFNGVSPSDLAAIDKDSLYFTVSGPGSYLGTIKYSEFATDADNDPDTYTLNGLPVGTYSVSESGQSGILSNYILITEGNDASVQIVNDVEVSKDTPGNAHLINNYKLNKGSVFINKYGLVNESCTKVPADEVALKGVEFTLTKRGEDTFTPIIATTDENGMAVFENLVAGLYEIKETKTLDNYVLDINTYLAEIDATGNYSGLMDSSSNVIEGNKLTNDLYRADIELKKVSLQNKDETLPGSTYGLFMKRSALSARRGNLYDALGGDEAPGYEFGGTSSGADSNDNFVEIAEATTDRDGVLRFRGIIPDVEYTIKELASPYGYYVSENPISIEFTADNNGAVSISSFDSGSGTALQMVDGTITWLEPEIEVSFAKQDMQGEYLPGSELKVVDKNGDDVISWTSTSEAYVVNGEFIAGETYSLVEVKAPDGYKLADPVTFTIPEKAGADGAEVVSVVMKDEKISESSETPKEDTPSKTPSKNETPAEVKTPTKSETPTTTVTKSTVAVDTGDHLPVKLIVVLLAVALIGFVSVIIIKKRVNR